MRPLHQRPDAAKIRLPAAGSDVMSVADPVSVDRTLSADFTCACHKLPQISDPP